LYWIQFHSEDELQVPFQSKNVCLSHGILATKTPQFICINLVMLNCVANFKVSVKRTNPMVWEPVMPLIPLRNCCWNDS